MMEKRKDFFEKIMSIVDDAEGTRDTTYGPFSFLWENSYVREAVVSSFDTTTSITGLKMYLAMNVLELHAKGNASRISYEQLKALFLEKSSKKYSLNYLFLDECIDVEKNKKIILEKIYTEESDKERITYLERTRELIPYLFMDRLRKAVWSKLRDFLKLCEQSVCSECSKKSLVYFQFIQAVALYEIFYIELVQEKAANYMEEFENIVSKTNEEMNKLKQLSQKMDVMENKQLLEQLINLQQSAQEINNCLNETVSEKIYQIEIYQHLIIEFGISLNAMCYLIMILEAMQVCSFEMQGVEQPNYKIREELKEVYDKDLAILAKSNHKRLKRYRSINKKIVKLLENQYPKRENIDEAMMIHGFIKELCKPIAEQNKEILRGFEVMMGYPIYHQHCRNKERSQESDSGGNKKI